MVCNDDIMLSQKFPNQRRLFKMKATKVLAMILVLAMTCLLFAACNPPKNNGADTGKATDTAAETAAALTIVGEWASEDYDGAYVYTFNEDGTGNYDVSGTDMPFTYTAENGKLSILYDGNTAPFETEYTLTETALTLKDSFGDDVVYLKK